MKLSKYNIHLFISAIIVLYAGICYGFFPDVFLKIHPSTADEFNFQKAIMMLYLGFASIWLLGLLNASYLKTAMLSQVVFMLALALGRMMSMALDGIPSNFYLYGVLGELFLGVYGVWALITNHEQN
ncbi:DUF4345 domain-containing protein [Winogradskyella maritima]|uniref:DUF4345 domain-containing protein n=1 Tax=Winogradskyella maritima TaxID=1517766 RepID=A0ABV8AI03_9FLAO|nr:DUF4345 domain-containing protein [Winogradskyella maritima]